MVTAEVSSIIPVVTNPSAIIAIGRLKYLVWLYSCASQYMKYNPANMLAMPGNPRYLSGLLPIVFVMSVPTTPAPCFIGCSLDVSNPSYLIVIGTSFILSLCSTACDSISMLAPIPSSVGLITCIAFLLYAL